MVAGAPFDVATSIQTGLQLAALVVLVLYQLFRSHLGRLQSVLVFVLALVAIVFSMGTKIYEDHIHPARYWVEGYVYSPPGDDRDGLPKATVTMQVENDGSGPKQSTTDETGHYIFEINQADFGKQADLRASLRGYKNSDSQSKTLSESVGNVNFWLAPSDANPVAAQGVAQVGNPAAVLNGAGVPGAASACLNGDWPERLVGGGDPAKPPHWLFAVQGSALHISRRDNFVQGDFHPAGSAWNGDLKWGNGDVWHNVILTPSNDCMSVATNQAWFYER